MATVPDLRLEQALAHAQFLRSVARAVLGGDAEAEDVLQETFLVAWQTEPREPGALRAWLAGIARRLALTRRRSARRREAREWRAATPEALPSVEDVALREEARRVLVAPLLALEEPYRTTLMWRYYAGRRVADIAALQAVPVNTVRTRIQRGLGRLREGLASAHGGDGRRWRSALLPLASGGFGFLSTAATVTGGLLVKKALVVGLAALVLVAAGVALWTGDSGRPTPAPAARDPLEAATAATGAATTESSVPHLEGRGAAASPAPAAGQPARYGGDVVDGAGAPVAGARVEVRGLCNDEGCASRSYDAGEGKPLAETQTTAEGRFRLPAEFDTVPWDPRPHAVWVHVVAEGFALAQAAVARDAPARIVLGRGGAIALTLVDEEGRAPRAARVEVYRGEAQIPPDGWAGIPRVWVGHPGEDGRLEQRLASGTYRLRVTAAGLRPIHTEALTVVEGGRVERWLTLDAGIVLDVVVSGPDGLPLANAHVRALGPMGSAGEARTDSEGRATLAGIGLPLGDNSEQRYIPHAQQVAFAIEAEGLVGVYGWRRLPPGRERLGIEVHLVPGIELRVRLVDRGGTPVPEPLAQWEPPPGDASRSFPVEPGGPSPDGWIVLPGVRPGSHSVSLRSRADGWVARTVPVTVADPGQRMDLVLERSDGVLAGRVLLPDGSPATQGNLHYEADGVDGQLPARLREGPIGADGAFRLERLPSGSGSVLVRTPARAAQRFPVVVAPDGSAPPLSLRLRPGRPVRGRVVGRDGRGLERATVRVETVVSATRGGQQINYTYVDTEVRTGADGRFEIEAEEGLVLRLVATLGGWRPMQGNPEQARPGDADVVLRMKPDTEPWGLPLHLRVTSGGTAYTGALAVRWDHPTGARMASVAGTDGKGLYHFGVWDLPGRFTLTLHATGHRPTILRDLDLEESPDGTTRDVALDRGAVFRLRLRDAAGRPLADAQVSVTGSVLRSDPLGEVEVGGFEREGRAFDLPVSLAADPEFTSTHVRIGERSGTYDVVLQRIGVISVRMAEAWSSLRQELHLQAVGGDGRVLHERRYAAAHVQGWKSAIWTELRVPLDGTVRVVATLDGRSGETVVEARVGTRVETRVALGPGK